ncbi:hypothetical protein NDI76_05955 [Halogeometricum sp. S1BR25-6]|uniref:Uncharacterized protein n=1 Tax=Halogeometricum salsisoli TaxID=2950536 RepID=A0ABU2GD93_9EURY|nr:hypothetical protein [Halogeometricum sp. S1BR25-6]MDS0298279.1 hypothetical protein [Halogeometricum sp. S1BR25-6]
MVDDDRRETIVSHFFGGMRGGDERVNGGRSRADSGSRAETETRTG